MCTTLLLSKMDFTKTSILECDDYWCGKGAILVQAKFSLPFSDKHLCEQNFGKSNYWKETIAILQIVETWWPYLIEQHLYIKTNQHSLKYFLEQRLSSPKKHKWVTTMVDYDYKIIYNKGRNNVVEYGLSKQFEEEDSLFTLFLMVQGWINKSWHESLA